MAKPKENLSGSELYNWDKLHKSINPGSILLGNGASLAVWAKFGYSSLFEEACRNANLDEKDRALFSLFGEHNFEDVLCGLQISGDVCEALDIDAAHLRSRYSRIRRALVDAVHATHVQHQWLDGEIKTAICEALDGHRYIFTTNYDLILYWSIAHARRGTFKDFFWNGTFDPADASLWNDSTGVIYLHGGLHLARRPGGEVVKLRNDGVSILNLFTQAGKSELVPLVIAEGNSARKRASILGSPYLAFALGKLRTRKGTLTVFGHSLSDQDQHIVDAINESQVGSVCVSIFGPGVQNVKAEKARYKELLPEKNLLFFDAQSHPLGATKLRVEAPEFDAVEP